MSTLQELMDKVAEGWPFDAENYPPLKNCPCEKCASYPGYEHFCARAFALRHIAEHSLGSVDTLIGAGEAHDHGVVVDQSHTSTFQMAAAKLFVNALRIAAVLGLKQEDLEKWIASKYGN